MCSICPLHPSSTPWSKPWHPPELLTISIIHNVLFLESMYSYKFPCKHCFFCVTNFDKLYFHLVQNIFQFLLRLLVWPMCYWELCFLISKYLGIFQLSFCYWFLKLPHVFLYSPLLTPNLWQPLMCSPVP